MFENEEWRTVQEEYLSHYMISDYGRVKHKDRVEARAIVINDKGFPVVTLYGADSKTRYLRHINKLVAKAFLPPPHYSNETAVWHKDGDLTNCRAENLMWDTRARVMEWNDMQRRGRPNLVTKRVKNNRTGKVYDSAYHCAMDEGRLESDIVFRIERQGRSMYDETARYMFLPD